MDCNCFSGENVHILVELIRICPKLSSLSCAKCELDSSDIKNLLGNTVSLTELETWSLQSNNLSDRGCSHLVASLDKYLPKVTGIFLHDNPKITKVRLLQSLETKISKHRVSSTLNLHVASYHAHKLGYIVQHGKCPQCMRWSCYVPR